MTYSGRGRRPIWCSARCRTAASIEQRGNRPASVQPRVVEVVRTREVSPKPTVVAYLAGSVTRRPVDEWLMVLDDLRRAIATGSLYDRDLVHLTQPLTGVLEAFERRNRRR